MPSVERCLRKLRIDSQINRGTDEFLGSPERHSQIQNGTSGRVFSVARSADAAQRTHPHRSVNGAARTAALRDGRAMAARAGPGGRLGGQRRRHDGAGRGVAVLWLWVDVCVSQRNWSNGLGVQCAIAV